MSSKAQEWTQHFNLWIQPTALSTGSKFLIPIILVYFLLFFTVISYFWTYHKIIYLLLIIVVSSPLYNVNAIRQSFLNVLFTDIFQLPSKFSVDIYLMNEWVNSLKKNKIGGAIYFFSSHMFIWCLLIPNTVLHTGFR